MDVDFLMKLDIDFLTNVFSLTGLLTSLNLDIFAYYISISYVE